MRANTDFNAEIRLKRSKNSGKDFTLGKQWQEQRWNSDYERQGRNSVTDDNVEGSQGKERDESGWFQVSVTGDSEECVITQVGSQSRKQVQRKVERKELIFTLLSLRCILDFKLDLIYSEESRIEESGLRKEMWAVDNQAYQPLLIFDTTLWSNTEKRLPLSTRQ